jgi:AbrB family looped-hinge helix DNA binding protein
MKQITLEAVTLGQDNQITLPAEYVQALGIGPGDLLELRLEDGQISVTRKRRLSIREAAKKYGRPGKAPTLEELRLERGWDDWE